MNTEELKMILDLVATVSGDAKSVAIWYFVAKYAFTWVGSLIAATTFIIVVSSIIKAISSSHEWSNHARLVSKAYGGDGGTFCYHSDEAAFQKAIKNAPDKGAK